MRRLFRIPPLTSHKPRTTKMSRALRLAAAAGSLLMSVALALTLLLHAQSAAHADPTLIRDTVRAVNPSYAADPWSVIFDGSGNVWVAEPQCDVNVNAVPICSHTSQGSILEYSMSGFNNGTQPWQILTVPTGYSSPFFLKFDGSGNLWFTEPLTNAIGEYTKNGTWNQYPVKTANASPLDLTIDQYGHIWFTELSANQVGELDPSSGTVNEYGVPTSGSQPYGIAGPDPTTHSIWFTENSQYVHRIGQLTPNPDGTINGSIQEYLTNTSTNGDTPHLITYDNNGNIWWTEGYDGEIGKLVINQRSNGTSQGVTEYAVPAPDCPNPPIQGVDCGSHTSGISIDGNGNVWFDDSRSSRYGMFNPSTQSFNMYIINGCVTNNTHPHDGLAVDSNNNVWFTEEFGSTLDEALPGSSVNPTPCPSPSPGSSPTPSPSPSPSPNPQSTTPVSKQWYFAEGRVGKGFTEYLTIGNPTGAACQVNVQYLYTPDKGASQTKTLTFGINASTRHTSNVDQDLGTSPGGIGIDVSTIVTVNSSLTPNCAGVVAERPMYFTNVFGVNSGHDALGATHLSTSFYFADVSSLPGYRSFITILNPPGGATANVRVTYYQNGSALGTDTLPVPAGTRGTITPHNYGERVAALVTSDQPIAVERPTYFYNYRAGNATTVSGAAVVAGAPSLSNDWLFAEGYTGGQFQENFVIANIDTSANAAAVVTIRLEFPDTTTKTFTLSVPSLSQVVWNVNAVAPGVSVSAEITSSNAKIVAEREMFFRYNHKGNGRVLNATGGTDDTGQIGPASISAYSFAEGYTNNSYDEWLTLQNPTNSSETIVVTLVNGTGHTSTFNVQVGPHSRSTTDLVHSVLSSLCSPGAPSACWEISMTVQTLNNGGVFVAERPMYFNASGSQGGTDILGYIGN